MNRNLRIASHRAYGQSFGLQVLLVTAASQVLTGCHSAVLDPQGPIGQADKTILIDSLAIMLAIVVPTILATLGFAWWYRASNTRARYLPEWASSGRIELVVWSIPVMVIILLGGVAWIGSHALDPARPLASKTEPIDIEVVSLDWKWLFIYPRQRIATVNQLTVPTGVPLHFSLTSASVMNAFYVPQLGSMIYTMNGMVTQLNLRADAPGTFRGLSSQFSGEGFSDMHFDVHAVSTQQFAAWVDATHGNGPELDEIHYAALALPSVHVPASTYGSVATDLFKRIANLTIPPGAPQAPAQER
jgi:cytochrome o ubiquinol oxidase subunit 2